MIITKPRDWARIVRNLDEIDAKRGFIMGCGQCATVAKTGGEPEILQAKARLEQEGREVTGWAVGEVVCHQGDCVLDATAGICPVTTCPKGLLNGPCGGMWNGKCEVLTDRECTHVRIQRRLAEQGRQIKPVLPAKDYSAKQKPGAVNLRTKHGESGDTGE